MAAKRKTTAAKPRSDATRKTSLALPEDLWRRAKIRAAETDTDMRSVIIAALEAFLKD